MADVIELDRVDAAVVICARRTGQGVVTIDPEDLSRLDVTLQPVLL